MIIASFRAEVGGGFFYRCCFNEHGLREDHNTFVVIFPSVVVWSARQSVSNLILLSWFVFQCKVIVCEFYHISGESSVDVFRFFEA